MDKNIIEENLKVGLIDILILKLLSEDDMYGYQIRQEILLRSNNTIEIKEGSLYGPLYRLEKKKMISSSKVVVGKKRFRMYYKIEKLGKDYLDDAIDIFNQIYLGARNILKGERMIDDVNKEWIKTVFESSKKRAALFFSNQKRIYRRFKMQIAWLYRGEKNCYHAWYY